MYQAMALGLGGERHRELLEAKADFRGRLCSPGGIFAGR